ncbi:MAG: substrate-binding domain-containing protein [Bacteroidales bacterium]|nr:substrate-binding domain-containing protein [Bacteroidales bacterium]
MKNNFKINLVIVLAFAIALSNCTNSGNKIDETPTSGNIKASIEESYKLLFDTEIFVFQTLYKNAKVNAAYKSEGDALEDYFRDSVRFIVINRKLTKNEENKLISKNIIPRTTRIAYDALALIVNKNNNDSAFTFEQIKEIFEGKISKWKQININSKLSDMIVVFDNNKSCNPRYIKEKLELKKDFPSNCFAVNSNQEVINYVEKNKNALGIISVNWVSDSHDSVTIDFLHKVKVVAVGSESGADPVKPYQGYIADGSYPFTREVYMISRETFAGLGTGFVSFVAGEKGQRIILKSGLVPATMPVRLIEVKR